jgi:hypothetical protein
MDEVRMELVRVRCPSCSALTEHKIQRELETTAAPVPELDPQPLFVCVRAQILECQVCANICFRKGWSSATEVSDQTRWAVFPGPEERKPFAAADLLPESVGRLYRETLQTINGRSFTLAAGGMRAVVEAICQQQGCKGQDLQQRISKLKGSGGVIGTREASAMNRHIRVWGNEALHRMRQPSPAEIYEALEILEHVLRTLYELPHRGNNLTLMRDERLQDEAKIEAARESSTALRIV